MLSRGETVFWVAIVIVANVAVAGAILDPGDFLGLQSIRKSLSDLPGSTFFSDWDFTGDPCGFSGVLCSGDRVVSLALGDPRAGAPGLSGHLDPAVGQLSALTELSLVPGRVLGRVPSTLSNCSDLRFLALSRNFLSGPVPSSLASLHRLRTLDLSYNLLSGALLSALPSSLTNLLLCHNRLSGPLPSSLSSSHSLTRLELHHNRLSGPLPRLPSSLRYLSLSSNLLSGPPSEALSSLSALTFLDLSMNAFSGEVPGCLLSLPLSSLLLQRNQFAGEVRPLGEVMIQTVDLSFNRLYGEISPLLSTVQSLYLNNNRFTGRVPGSLVTRLMSSEIQVLYLQHNFLTGIEMDPTAEIPIRSSLCLQYNCMVPPVQTTCPVRAGKQKTRPTAQCSEWTG